MVKARDDFKITHPQFGKDGQPDKQLGIITLGRRLSQTNLGDPQSLIRQFMAIDGIDAIQPIGLYTVQIIIANTFDYEAVLAEVHALLERAVSAIIIPINKNAPKVTAE
jgi:hypothetical protein